MHISLTPELERLVQAKVESGLYGDASEVMREALRCFLAHEQEDAQKLAALRQAVAIGVAEAERGEFSEQTISDMIASMEARYPV